MDTNVSAFPYVKLNVAGVGFVVAGGIMRRRKETNRVANKHDALALEVLKQFRLVYGAVNRHFRDIERRCGLSGAQAWLLRELSRSPLLGVTDLATRMSVHQSTASQLIEKLVRAGYVERATHEEDKRRVRLRISRRGRACLKRLPQPAEGVLPRALGKLPGPSLRALRSSLARLISQLQTRRAQDAQAPLGEL